MTLKQWWKKTWSSIKRYYGFGGGSGEKYICSNCNSKISNPNFCRQCGASEESGWSSYSDGDFGSGYSGEEDFDYDEFVENEFGTPNPKKNTWSQLFVTMLIVLLCVSFVFLSLGIL